MGLRLDRGVGVDEDGEEDVEEEEECDDQIRPEVEVERPGVPLHLHQTHPEGASEIERARERERVRERAFTCIRGADVQS